MPSALMGVAALILASAGTTLATTPDLTIQDFSSNANGVGINWGSSAYSYDAANGDPAGSLYVTSTFGSGSDTPFMPFICINGGNPWNNQGVVDFSLYSSIDFDIKWDPTSDITVAQFNDLSTWGPTMTNKNGSLIMQGWAGSGYLSGSTPGLELDLCGPDMGSGTVQNSPEIGVTNIPAAAALTWAHMSYPINPAISGLANKSGITLHKWISQNWGIASNALFKVWIDNIVLKGNALPPPPPTVEPLGKTGKGLNVFASTAGQYDRQSAALVNNAGRTWVGSATAANPVTYSFTINSFPQNPATYGCEAWLFLIPNPNYLDIAPDWNETNAVIAFIQQGATNAILHFQYKVNEPAQQQMYSGAGAYTNAPGSWDGVTPNYLESGDLTNVTSLGSAVGTWTIKFTSDTNVTLIAPDGSTASCVIPNYNVGNFAFPTMNVYLGMQPNNAATANLPVIYSNFAISGTANPVSDNFLTDTVLNTNIWTTAAATGPHGVLVVPATAAYWASWTLPDTGFGLQIGASLTNMGSAWISPTANPIIGMVGENTQLIDKSELPAGGTAFFNMIKRTVTQLQVLMPGQTNAPGTTLGYTGTPTPISLAAQGLTTTTVTVNACDASWHIVGGYSDIITISTTDGAAYVPTTNPIAMVNGTATFADPNGILFVTQGATTCTATNSTTLSATSASFNVVP